MSKQRAGVLAAILAVVLLAGALRLHWAATFNTDWDEDDYIVAAGYFVRLLEQGDLRGIPEVQQMYEHPPLGKLLFALTADRAELDLFPTENVRYTRRIPLPPNSLDRARWQSVGAGTLTVLIAAAVTPLGGLALAIQSIHAHFSSVAYIDAWATLFTTLAAVLYNRQGGNRARALAGACLGLAVAVKYPYAVAGIALLLHALIIRRWRWRALLVWGGVAGIIFLAFNPYLWPDPIHRLRAQLQYHHEYTRRDIVVHRYEAPLRQMVQPDKHLKHLVADWDDYAILNTTDRVLFWLALPGLAVLLFRRSVYGWWLVVGFAFLMIWPTQWVQHNMLIVVPYSMAAAVLPDWLARRLLGGLVSLMSALKRRVPGLEPDRLS